MFSEYFLKGDEFGKLSGKRFHIFKEKGRDIIPVGIEIFQRHWLGMNGNLSQGNFTEFNLVRIIRYPVNAYHYPGFPGFRKPYCFNTTPVCLIQVNI